jgi:hypothetical protein
MIKCNPWNILVLVLNVHIYICIIPGFKIIRPEIVHACLIRLIGIRSSRSSSQSWILCGLKNKNNNNIKSHSGKGEKREEKKMHSHNNSLGNLFFIFYFFFSPLCTPSEVDRVKNFVVFSTVHKGLPFFLRALSPFPPARYLFLNNTRTRTITNTKTHTHTYIRKHVQTCTLTDSRAHAHVHIPSGYIIVFNSDNTVCVH